MASRYHFLNLPPSPGEKIGEALGTGLGTGLAQFAESKLKSMVDKQQMEENKRLLREVGIPESKIDYMVTRSPEEQWEIVRALWSAGGGDENELPMTLDQQQPSRPQQAQEMQAMGQGPAQPQATVASEGVESVGAEIPPQVQQQPKAPLSAEEKKEKRFSEALRKAPASSPKKGSDLAERKFQYQKGEDTRKFNQPYQEAAQAAENNIRDYDQMITIAERGDIRSPNMTNILSKLGFEGFNQNIDTQALNKLTARLSQNARSAFGTGTRLTNFLEQTYQRSLPSLWNTTEGIIFIAKLNKLAEQAIIERNKARQQVLAETGNELTPDIVDRINERAKPHIQALEENAFDLVNLGPTKATKKFEKLPSASEYKGKKIRNPETGEVLISDGKKWARYKG